MKYSFDLNLKTRNSASLLLKRIRPNSTVLEFGLANGRMTKYLKEVLNCKVYAVEIDPLAAKNAKEYAENIIVDNIENYTWIREYSSVVFDYAIFADVLEHLYEPEKVLCSVRNLLHDDGCILISIPNIAHNSIVINLLRNRFDYTETGLLDNTHIRFFTKKTFDSLIKNNEYFISYESAVIMPPNVTEIENDYDDLPYNIGEFLKSNPWGEMYQLIYELKKYGTDCESELDLVSIDYCKYHVQLYFTEKDEQFSENESMILFLNENVLIHNYQFDLSNRNIKKIRLDPLNEACVLEVKSLVLDTDDDSINLIPLMSTNASAISGNLLYFDTKDPQIFFENIDENLYKNVLVLKVSIEIKFFGHDALHECLKKSQNELELKTEQLKNIYDSKLWKWSRKIYHGLNLFKR